MSLEPPMSSFPFDVLSGTPTEPLTLQPGAPGRNLGLANTVGLPTDSNLLGCGDAGCTNAGGFGEGAFAVMFPGPVSEFGFISGGGDTSGETVVQFFRADGTGIAQITVPADPFPAINRFGFRREGDIKDIAGVSIHTSDPGGLLYDSLRYGDVAGLSISCTPPSLDSTSLATCTIETPEGLDDPVMLSCESLPDGAFCNFTPDEVIIPVPGSASVELSMTVDDRVPESFLFQAVATSGSTRGTFTMTFDEPKTIPPVPPGTTDEE